MAPISEAASKSGVGPSKTAPVQGQVLRKLRGRVAHKTRGRVRLQFPRSSPAELQQIEAGMRRLPNVGKVEIHPKTGSIIVHHTAQHGQIAAHLADLAKHSGLFYLEGEDNPSEAAAQLTDVEHDAAYLTDHSKAGKAIVRYSEHLNRAVKHVTDGWVDLRVLLPATAGLCALLFVEIESAPLWLPLALFSFQSFNNLHQPHPTTEGEAGRWQAALPAGTPASGEEDVSVPTAVEVEASAIQRPKRASRRTPATQSGHEGTA